MTESFFPLTALSEVQRAQDLERFTIIRPALEDGVSQAQVACASRARGMNRGSDLGKDAPYPSGLLGADRLSPIPRVRWRPNPHA